MFVELLNYACDLVGGQHLTDYNHNLEDHNLHPYLFNMTYLEYKEMIQDFLFMMYV